MYIKRVVIRNVKGFESADLDFCPDAKSFPGWAVVTGDNGSGKTALLRSIALAILGPEQVRGIVQDLRGWVAEGEESGTISVEVRPDHDFDRTAKGGQPTVGTFWAEVEVSREGDTVVISPTDVFRRKKVGAANGPWPDSTTGWFMTAYGPFRRLYGTSPDAQRLMMVPGRIPRFATLFKEDATLGEGEEWVRELQYKRLEDRRHESEVLDNLLMLVRDDFLHHGVAIDEVNSDGIWLHDGAGHRLPLTEMSDGYRAALAMLLDVFRHMVNAYGVSIVKTDESTGHQIVDRPGVVLIDEVDAHLHPEWQREIGFWLKQHFPRVQFIVTTHSPLVAAAADNGRIYHLPPVGGGRPFRLSPLDYGNVIAGRADEILLTPAFGLVHTRSPRAVRARERHAVLMSKQLSFGLSPEEAEEAEQLSLFASVD